MRANDRMATFQSPRDMGATGMCRWTRTKVRVQADLCIGFRTPPDFSDFCWQKFRLATRIRWRGQLQIILLMILLST
jgi:hypothetical protein